MVCVCVYVCVVVFLCVCAYGVARKSDDSLWLQGQVWV